MTRTFNPNLLKQPIFNTLDIAVPVLTPLVNVDQIVSVLAGVPRGTIDNIVNNINQINNFLTTPAATRVSRRVTTWCFSQGRFVAHLDDAFDNHCQCFEYENNDEASLQGALRRLGHPVPGEQFRQQQNAQIAGHAGEYHRLQPMGQARKTSRCCHYVSEGHGWNVLYSFSNSIFSLTSLDRRKHRIQGRLCPT